MKSIIEGLLFVSGDEGIDVKEIAAVLEIDPVLTQTLVDEMKEEFESAKRGIRITEMAGTYQLTSRPEHASYFEKLAYTPSNSTLSQAALETLSIIAYKQPITRIEIEEIRGVKSDSGIHRLMAKQLIRQMGRAEAVGRPILYGTTDQFLDYLGLNSLADLPNYDQFEMDEHELERETRMLFDKLHETETKKER